MPIRLSCPSCSAALSVKDEFAGRAVKCPKCGGVIPPSAQQPAPLAPAAEGSAEPPESGTGSKPAKAVPAKGKAAGEDEGRPRKWRPDDEDGDRPRKRRRREGDEDDRPVRRKEKGGSGVMVVATICGTLLLCCGGAGAWYFVYSVKKGVAEFAENLTPTNEKVTAANYQKLKLTTPRAEVEAILGPGQHAPASEVNLVFAGQPPRERMVVNAWRQKASEGKVLIWRNRGDCLLAAFHRASGGRLQFKAFIPQNGSTESTGIGDDVQFAQMLREAPDEKPNDAPNSVPNNPPVQPKPNDKEKEEPPPGPLTRVSAQELAKEFRDGEAGAAAKYKDQWLEVEGKVLDVVPGATDGLVRVKLAGVNLPRNNFPFSVWCDVRDGKAEARDAWDTARGQSVTIKGKCTGGGVLQTAVNLKNCRVERKGSDPSVKVPAGLMIAQYSTKPDPTNDKYRDKEVLVVGATFVSLAQGSDLVILGGQGRAGAAKIKLQANFTFGQRKKLEELKPGQFVTFRARCGGLFGDHVAFYDAYLQ